MIRLNKNKGLSKQSPTIIIFENENPQQQIVSPRTNNNHNTNNINSNYKNYDRRFSPVLSTTNKHTKQLNQQAHKFLLSKIKITPLIEHPTEFTAHQYINTPTQIYIPSATSSISSILFGNN